MGTSYTQLFSEGTCLLAQIALDGSYASEQNTGYVSLANYHRAYVLVVAGTLGADLDIDIEEGTSTAGAGAQSFDSGGKDKTIHNADDDTVTIIEINADECDVADGYYCINVEATPGATSEFWVGIFGVPTRFAPVPTTNIEDVVN